MSSISAIWNPNRPYQGNPLPRKHSRIQKPQEAAIVAIPNAT